MATLVLGAAGAALGGLAGAPTIGRAVGAGVGSVLDTILVNRLFDETPDVKPPDFVKSLNADEGAGAPWCAGELTRVPGQIIWMTEPKAKKIPGEDKGKSPQETAYKVLTNMAIAWCRNQTNQVRKIWANGEVIYFADGVDVVLEGEVLNVRPHTWYEWTDDPASGNAKKRKSSEEITYTFLTSAQTSQFLNEIQFLLSGFECTVSNAPGGTLDPENTGFFVLRKVTRLQLTADAWEITVRKCRYEYTGDSTIPNNSCSPGVEQLAINTNVLVQQVVDGSKSPYFKNIECYNGTNEQDPDPLMEAQNTTSVSGHRGTTYCVIEDLDLSKWGGQVPSFEAEIDADTELELDTLLQKLINRAGNFKANWVDLNPVGQREIPVYGYATIGPISVLEHIQNLLALYDVEAQEITEYKPGSNVPNPVIQFNMFDKVATTQVALQDATAREEGNEGDKGPRITRSNRQNIPQTFSIDFVDPNNDLQNNTYTYTVASSASQANNTQQMTLPITLFSDDASELAKKLLWAIIYRHDKAIVKLPPSYLEVIEGDRLNIAIEDDDDLQLRVTQVDNGQNGLIEIEGQVDDSLLYNRPAVDPDPPKAPPGVPYAPYADVQALDLPPLTSAQAIIFGLNLATPSVQNQSNFFQGVSIYSTIDDGATWTLELGTSGTPVAGRTTAQLQDADHYYWDIESTLDVVLDSGELNSATREQVARGINWCVVGREIIGFASVEVIGDGNYRLTELMRGLRNTEQYTGTHEITERFIVLDNNVQFQDLGLGAFKVPLTLRPVPAGRAVEDFTGSTDQQVIPQAESLKPFSVHGLWSTRNSNEDICVYASKRYRTPFNIFGAAPPIDVEPGCVESWIAKVYAWDGVDFIDVNRTICACEVHEGDSYMIFPYSREDQLQDVFYQPHGFLMPGDPFPTTYKFEIWRLSEGIVDGRRRTWCVDTYGAQFVSTC